MKRQNLRTVSLCVFTLTYLLIGAAIFGYLEFETEVKQREYLEFIERTIRKRYNISDDDYSVLWTTIIKSAPHKAGIQWKFPGAFYFATTVVTTIGYGHSTPSTVQGRTFCMLYALVGVPLGLVMFQCIGERLNSLVSTVLRKLKRSMKAKNQEVTETNKVMVVSVLSTILMTSMAAVFAKYEQWEYFDALYYCFITLTTIGFGDFVALQKNSALQQQPEYVVFSVVFILFGLSVVSSAVNLLVLKFLTLNTEDERRDELLKTNAAMNPIMIQGDVITSSAGEIEYVAGPRATRLAARRRGPPMRRRSEASESGGSGEERGELRPLNEEKKRRSPSGAGPMGSPTESGGKNESASESDREDGEDDERDDEQLDGSQSDLASQTSGGRMCDCRYGRPPSDDDLQWATSAQTRRTQQLKSPASGQSQMPPSRCSPGTKSAFSSSNGSLASFACAVQTTGAALCAGPNPTGATRTWLREARCNYDADENQPDCRPELCQEHQKCQQINQLGYQWAPLSAENRRRQAARAGQRRPHPPQAAGANQSSCSCSWVSLASDCAEPTGGPLAPASALTTTTQSNESLQPRPFLRPTTRIRASAAGGGCLSSSSLTSCLLLDPSGLVRSNSQERARGLPPLQGRNSLKHQALARLALRSPHAFESQDGSLAAATSVRQCGPKLGLMPAASGEHAQRQSGKPTRSTGELAHARRRTHLAAQLQQSDSSLVGRPVALDQDAAGRHVAPDICSSLDYAELIQGRAAHSRRSPGSATGTRRLVCRCCCQHAECIEFAIGAVSKGRGIGADHRSSGSPAALIDATFPEISPTFQQIAPPSPTAAAHCDKGGAPETNTPKSSPTGRHSDERSSLDAGPQAAGGVSAAPNSSCDEEAGKELHASTSDENHDTYDWPLES